MTRDLTHSALPAAIEHSTEPGGRVGIRGEQPLVFAHPSDVLEAPALTGSDKRALLAAWASDACAVEGRPALRWLPRTPEPVTVDDILSSLQALDREGLH